MLAAVLAEGETDEAFTRVIASHVLGTRLEPVAALPRTVTRSYPQVRKSLPVALRHLHYTRRDVHGLIVLVDTDESVVHAPTTGSSTCDSKCRVCQIRNDAARVLAGVSAIDRRPLAVAVGAATPAIESWMLFGTKEAVSEAEWIVAQNEERHFNVKRALKTAVRRRGVRDAGLSLQFAVDAANRAGADLAAFRQMFPGGFGALETDLRAW